MGKLTAVVSNSLEERVRSHIRKKGDLSRIIGEALEAWLKNKIEKKQKKGKRRGE